mmetsp:Transcript_31680/g.67324  ORF Transcript_31680/g.67324 Transcript_31680/m.67324 type:complete len:521 (+) Transcript_31680:109-1671(+)
MDPAARNFLQHALSAIERFDAEGRTVLPNGAWPEILEDLSLQEGSDAAYFLMDHLEAAGDGLFTYSPLLQALGIALPPPAGESLDEGLPPQQGQGMGPPQQAWQDPPTPPEARAGFDSNENDENVQYCGGDYNQAEYDCQKAQLDYCAPASPAQPLSPASAQQYGSPPRASPTYGDDTGYGGDTGYGRELQPQPLSPMSARPPHSEADWDRGTAEPVEEVGEAYWARRANAIQQLFTQWDCNLLTNETFVAKLQEVLGNGVDISSPESELVRKTNQHRTARNLKFAALMSALRRDANSTVARRMGRPLPSYAGSVAGSVYEPSEIGSEAPSHAAGRPTGGGGAQTVQAPPSRGGRRHYSHADGQMSGPSYAPSYAGSERSNHAQSERLQHSVPGPDSQPPPVYTPSSAQPCGRGGGRGGPLGGVDEDRSVNNDYYSNPRAGPPPANDQWEMQSQSGVTDIASVADSQREEFTMRNRTGHGNILTWGSDSRSITPHKKRTGRQFADDGPPRHMSSNIFSQR